MKSSIIALSLMGLAAAQPRRHAGHAGFHEKRDVVTEVDVVTAYAPDVIVYVDQDGNPVSTEYPGQTPATATEASSYAASTQAVSAEAYSSTAAAHAPAYTHSFGGAQSSAPKAPAPAYTSTSNNAPAYQSPAPAPQPSKGSSGSGSGSSGSSGSSSGSAPASGQYKGVSYSPYTNGGGCKSQSQVNADFDSISKQGYNLARIYGTDCNQVSTVYSAAKAHGMKVFAGVYDIKAVSSEISTICSAVNGDWSAMHTVSIGNELVNNGEAAPSDVIAAMGTARDQLKKAGYGGNVVTVDTFVAMMNHPELCKASDYAAANAHAFFDSQATPDQAGNWVLNKMQAVSAACGGMNTWITESGWPWKGDCNGSACPSPENQKTAISSINSAVSNNIVLFTAFNDLWKSDNAGTFGAEKYWGLEGDSSS